MTKQSPDVIRERIRQHKIAIYKLQLMLKLAEYDPKISPKSRRRTRVVKESPVGSTVESA